MSVNPPSTTTDSTVDQPLVGPADGDELHVMSYNLKFADTKPPHSWQERRPLMAALLNREQPTIIGTQEGLYGQLTDIARDLPARYDWIGQGRDGGSHGEFCAVFYDRERLEPVEFDWYWLSRRPRLVGSRSWARTVRMVTWVRFVDQVTTRELVVVNTHFDHESCRARVRSATLVRSHVAKLAATTPVLVMGDFNEAASTSSRGYRLLTDGDLVDTWLAADTRLTPAYGTYGGYQPPVVDGDRIDWILATTHFEVRAAAVNPYPGDGDEPAYPSDHFPIQVVARIR